MKILVFYLALSLLLTNPCYSQDTRIDSLFRRNFDILETHKKKNKEVYDIIFIEFYQLLSGVDDKELGYTIAGPVLYVVMTDEKLRNIKEWYADNKAAITWEHYLLYKRYRVDYLRYYDSDYVKPNEYSEWLYAEINEQCYDSLHAYYKKRLLIKTSKR